MNEQAAYRNTSIQTADRIRVISLLYDGAINFLNLSRRKLEQGDIAGRGMYLGKVTAIVGELSSCLDMEKGGEIAKNLDSLYTFITGRLIDISLRNDMKAYDDVLRVLNELRSGWKEMEVSYRRASATAPASAQAAKPTAAPAPAAAGARSLVGLRA